MAGVSGEWESAQCSSRGQEVLAEPVPGRESRDRPAGGASRAASAAGLLHEAILALLNEAGEAGLTRKQLWDKPPEAVKRNEPKFRQTMEGGVEIDWKKRIEGRGSFVYHLEE